MKGIPLPKNQQLLMLLFANDQVVISDTKDNLQKATEKLNKIITEHGLPMSAQKRKLVALKECDQVRSKIVIDKKIIEQVNSFPYLGNLMSYEKELDIDNKLNNYSKITAIINNMYRPQKNEKNK